MGPQCGQSQYEVVLLSLLYFTRSLKCVSWKSNYVQTWPPKVSNLAPFAAFPPSIGQIRHFWGSKLYMVMQMRLHRGCGPIVGSLHFHSLPVPCILQCHNGLKSSIKKHSYIFPLHYILQDIFFNFWRIWIWIPTYFWNFSETSRKELKSRIKNAPPELIWTHCESN